MRAPSNPTHPFCDSMFFSFLIGYTEFVKRKKKSLALGKRSSSSGLSKRFFAGSARKGTEGLIELATRHAMGHRAQAAPDGPHGMLKDRVYGISLFHWPENHVLMHKNNNLCTLEYDIT